MEPRLFRYIWRHSKRDQVALLLLVLSSLPFYFLSLNLPKLIVNQGIQGQGFERPGSTQPFLQTNLPFGELLTGQRVELFGGFALEQTGLLLALSFVFLALVIVNGAFKFMINTGKGRMGERMLRRLRYELADRVLRFPVHQVRRMKPAEVATMVKDEVEPLGGFIGDAFVSPVFLGGQALTALVFILAQSVWLGLVAVGVVVVQAFLIPRLRRRILVLGRQRQLTARQLAGRIGEVMDGAVEVHVNDSSNYERAELSGRLGRIFGIRYEIYQRKFFVKFLNNFLAQLTPFLFYVGGGLLAISGRLDIGALVAVIAAYKDLPGPVKELIDWDQQRNDVQIKYEQVIEQFQPAEILEPWVQDPDAEAGARLEGALEVASVALVDDAENRLLDGITFSVPLTDHVAVLGDANSGKDYIAPLLAGLLRPSAGEIRIGGQNLAKLPEAVTGRRLSYVGSDAYLFAASVRDNLLYGLKHRPVREPELDDEAARLWADDLDESRRSGNATLNPNADWIDYAAAGASAPAEIEGKLIEALRLVDMESTVYAFGLGGTIDPAARPDVARAILEARTALVERLADEGAEELVVRFDPKTYNRQASLAENLLFGTPVQDGYAAGRLAENPLVQAVVQESGLAGVLLDMGLSIARTMVEIFADLPPGHPFFEQFSFIEAADLPDCRSMVSRAENVGQARLGPAERQRLMALPFSYVEARHRLSLIDPALEARFVEARARLAERLAAEDPGAVEPYRPDAYNSAASIQDNVLFGRLAYGQAGAEETVGRAMTEVLDQLGLRDTVVAVGLDYQVGVGGKRLSPTQRQKLAVARAMLKRPDLLVLNEATTVMDGATQARLLDAVLTARRGQGVIWTLNRAVAAERFDRLLVLRSGRLVEEGSFAELNAAGSALEELLTAG